MAKKKKEEPKEDKSNWKLEVWDEEGHKKSYTLDWEGHFIDKLEEN